MKYKNKPTSRKSLMGLEKIDKEYRQEALSLILLNHSQEGKFLERQHSFCKLPDTLLLIGNRSFKYRSGLQRFYERYPNYRNKCEFKSIEYDKDIHREECKKCKGYNKNCPDYFLLPFCEGR